MPLSFDEWKTKLQSRWQAWTANPRAMLNSVGANSLYLGLAGTAQYPIVDAVARGDGRRSRQCRRARQCAGWRD